MDKTPKKKQAHTDVSIRVIGVITIGIAILLAFYAFVLSSRISEAEDAITQSEKRYVECSEAVDELQMASDYLTTQARKFVITGRKDCLDEYLNELDVADRRGKAVEVLRSNLKEGEEAAIKLERALMVSNDLAKRELAALRLASEYYGTRDVPSKVTEADLVDYDEPLEKEEKLNVATRLVLNSHYDQVKETIRLQVNGSSDALLAQLDADLENSKSHMQSLLFQLRISVALLLCIIMVLVLALFLYVLKPLGRYVDHIKANEPLETDGAYELHYLATAYNAMYEDNNKRIEQLREYAERDALTGISNRSGYDNFLATHTRNIALLLIDIDRFREFNAVYGHDAGDAVLIKLAEALSTAFRSTDFPCRIDGDRFAVVMTNMNADLRLAILTKMDIVNSILGDESAELPIVTVSVGAAFSTEDMDDHDIYDAACVALRQAKELGPSSIVIYGETGDAHDQP